MFPQNSYVEALIPSVMGHLRELGLDQVVRVGLVGWN